MEFVPLNTLDGSSGSVPIQVRICRLWDTINTKQDTLISLDMVVADSEGTPMWVQIKGSLAKRFRHLLAVGNIYLLKNFTVAATTCQYRPVDTKFRIFFSLVTTVKRVTVPVPSIPIHIFQFPTNAQIVERTDDPTYLVDVMGLLLSIGDVELVTGGRTKRDLDILCSPNGHVRTTLWAAHAKGFVAAHMLDEATGPVMIVVTAVTMRHYGGDYNFSGTGATQTFIDLDHEPVNKLRAKLAPSATPVQFLGRSPGTVSTTAEAMTENRVTISEILEAGWANQKSGYRMTFVGTIAEIIPRNGWYYYGCNKCKSKLTMDDGAYNCPQNCPVCNKYPMILFKLQFTVQDESDTLICTAMNNVAERMVDSSAKKLFNKLEAADTSIPKAILDLCGQELIFKIQLSTYNLTAGNDSFTVVDVFTPEMTGRSSGKSPAAGKSLAKPQADNSKGKRSNPNAQTEIPLTPQKRRSLSIVCSDSEDEK